MKAQAATEYLLLFAILFAILTPLFIYSTQTSNISIRTSKAKEAVNTIAEAANNIYKFGGGKTYVFVDIPSGVKYYYIGNKTIKLHIQVGEAEGDAVAFTSADVTGNLPTTEGRHKVYIEFIGNNTILIQAVDNTPPIVLFTSPSGTIPNQNITLRVMTNENSACKYDLSDVQYDSMSYSLFGSETMHEADLYNQPEGDYLYYVRCEDEYGNKMINSETISFTIDLSASDEQPPIVYNTTANIPDPKIIFAGERVCISAVATDNIGIDKAWVRITKPDGSQINETLDAPCITGNDIVSKRIMFSDVGNYTINTTFANDTSGNIGFESPYPNIVIEVRNITQELCESLYPCADYIDVGTDSVFYYKTDGIGLETADNEMASSIDISSDTIDDNVNTPDTSSVIRTRSGEKYECFVPFLNNDTSSFSKVIIYGRVRIIDENPFILRIYPYKNDGLHINSSIFSDFFIYSDILNEKVKWVELDVTDLARVMDGFGFTKFRITALNETNQLNDRFQFSELHFKVKYRS